MAIAKGVPLWEIPRLKESWEHESDTHDFFRNGNVLEKSDEKEARAKAMMGDLLSELSTIPPKDLANGMAKFVERER